MNTITIKGNLTADAELKILNDKTELITFNIAWNKYRKDEYGNFQPVASFFSVKHFKNKERQSYMDKLVKGAGVVLSGHIEEERWETDGNKRSKVVIIADEISFLQKYEKSEVIVPDAVESSDDTPF